MSLRVIFAGTPEFAARALATLLDAGFEVPLVLTQPDRPAGRGMKLVASPVKVLAQARGIEVFQPATLRDEAAREKLRAVGADVMVVAAYGLILPQAALDLPRFGCVNIHASLLPRWRGAAPIQRAILAGDGESGVCIMQMEAGLDTGPVLLREALPLAADETAQTLHDRLAALGARLVVDALHALPEGRLRPETQPEAGVTYAAKLDRGEAPLDWRRPAAELARQVRAFDPFPGATAQLGADTVKVWGARVAEGRTGAAPGTVLEAGREGVRVAAGDGALLLTELQKAGGRRLPAAAFLAGFPVQPGARFTVAAD